MPSRYDLFDCFGLEVELEHVIRGNLPRNLQENFNEDHDASVETPNVAVNPEDRSLFFEDPERILQFPRTTVGTEIVSRVFNMTDNASKKLIEKLMGWAYERGEQQQNFRSGIHVHISMAYNYRTLINLMKISAHMEQVFYYLGGMGYEFRGVRNDFTYCRPITKFGPSAIRAPKPFQCFTLENLYKAPNSVQFFDAYGGIDPQNPPGKYYPIRYNWMTLYNLLSKGTVEFRVFNVTLNPQYIWAAVWVSRHLCELAFNSSLVENLPENSIYDEHDKGHVLDTFAQFAQMVNMDRQIAKSAMYIIDRTPPIVAEPVYVYTHLGEGRFNMNYRFTEPAYINSPKKRIKSPDFVDSHRLAGERS